ncbi:hypothetical protein IGS61_25370 [Janthinobacterium sp. FW305-129]|uniref:hypothetical protein n=1 Tax=Janthinobacterium sp. FW305-129 TaxID=2775054 RepID=UPI001E3F4609|nr:hypothetical protein [Janthinobacterium sp. FW305-129]MCC7600843.1 hypothetical protein [Janthinobacterium sp. FW305-129]
MSTVPAQHRLAFRPRRQGWAVAAVAVLHLALLWAVMRPVHRSVEHDERVWLQLMPPLPAPRGFVAPVEPEPAPPRPQALPADPAIATSPPKATPATTPPEQPPDAPKAGALTLAQRALQAAGAIDRQLRAEHPQEFVAPPDTAQTRLAKGFAEAHAAVKPKWFEAARIELWSAPNDPKRIYRIITATGEYCIYMPDKGNMTLNLSARSGYAGFGEGTAAPCPIRF